MIKCKKIIAVIMTCCITGIGICGCSFEDGTKEEQDAGYITTVEQRNIANSITLQGLIASDTVSYVNADASNVSVTKVCVSKGDKVQPDTVIATLNTDDLNDDINEIYGKIETLTTEKEKQDALFDTSVSNATNGSTSQNNYVTQYTNAKNNADKAMQLYNETRTQYDALENEYTTYVSQSETSNYSRFHEAELYSKINNANILMNNYQLQIQSYNAEFEFYYNLSISNTSESFEAISQAKSDYDEKVDYAISAYWAQIDSLKEQQENTTLLAGIAGTVTAVYVKEGNAYNGQTAAIVESNEGLNAYAYIDEGVAELIGANTSVIVTNEAGAQAAGNLVYTSLDIENNVLLNDISAEGDSSRLVKVSLLTAEDKFTPGEDIEINIIVDEHDNILSVPVEAVKYNEDGSASIAMVCRGENVTDDDFASKEIEVKVGLEGSKYVEVYSDKITIGTKIFVPPST